MRKFFFLFLTSCMVSTGILGQNISFQATSERVVVVGQQFRLAFTLTTGGETGKDFNLPDIKDFDVTFGPITSSGTSTQADLVSGKVSTQVTNSFIYTLMAKNAGTFTIPPATIKVGNSEYKSNTLEIKVLPPDQTANAAVSNSSTSNQQGGQAAASGISAEDIFIRAQVSKNSVYENERILITFKLYTAVDLRLGSAPKFPEYEGFVAHEIELPQNAQWTWDNYNGRNYHSAILKQTILYPQRSGKITIPACNIEVIARIRNPRRQRSIFEDFFDMTEEVKRPLISNAVTIDVKPLPPEKPASFTGAVGDYKMKSSISTNQLKTNDAVTVKIEISGNGNIAYLKNPTIVFPNDFDVLDQVVNAPAKVTLSGVTGSKTIEYNAIPRYAGDFTIPSAEFSYFDLKTEAYRTLKTDEFQLHVEQGEGGGGMNMPVVNATNKEDIRFLGKDIRYIKTDSAHFHKGDFFFGTLQYLLFYIVPALLFLILFWIYRKQAAQNANIALVRTKKANKVAAKRLKATAKYLKENKTELFYDETLRAVWGYLSDKLNISVSALTKDNVDANLMKYGAAESLIKDFRNILDTAEFARFAPAQASGTMDELYNATVQAIDKMENTIKKL